MSTNGAHSLLIGLGGFALLSMAASSPGSRAKRSKKVKVGGISGEFSTADQIVRHLDAEFWHPSYTDAPPTKISKLSDAQLQKLVSGQIGAPGDSPAFLVQGWEVDGFEIDDAPDKFELRKGSWQRDWSRLKQMLREHKVDVIFVWTYALWSRQHFSVLSNFYQNLGFKEFEVGEVPPTDATIMWMKL